MTGWTPQARAASLKAQQVTRQSRIEDYLMIGGAWMSAADAAARIGVSASTIFRYRRALRAGA